MGLATIMRALQDGHVPAMRTGLLALVLGTVVVISSILLLSPAVDGLTGLTDHRLDRPLAQPRVASKPAMTQAQRAVARRTAVRVAVSQMGVAERRGNNDGARIRVYRRAVMGPGEKPWVAEPWCADFVSWAWRRAGAPLGFDAQGSDYVPELVAWARLTRRWHWARDGYRPKPGDLIVFRSGGESRGHIGMVSGVGRGKVVTVEGNYSDRVSRRVVRPWDPVVTGFISPV